VQKVTLESLRSSLAIAVQIGTLGNPDPAPVLAHK